MKKTSKTTKKTPKQPGVKTRPARHENASTTVKTFSKYVHPYGTLKHADINWHVKRLNARIAKMDDRKQSIIQKAYSFANKKHEGQVRKGRDPFVIHPVRIANILLFEWSCEDPHVISAALLHDVVEDTATTIKEVKDIFGNDIGKLVDGMTMWKGSETYETYVKRVARGPSELRLIKCADSLDNLRSWFQTDASDAFPRWWRNTDELILPMAATVSRATETAIRRVLEDPWYQERAGMA